MKRFFGYCCSVMSFVFILSSCGGGGDSVTSGGGGPTDSTAPVVSVFTMPLTATSQTVSVSAFTATDAVGVTGYLITSSAAAPAASTAGWAASAPASYLFPAAGSQTAYAWAKDAAGNVSLSKSSSVTITLPTGTAKPVQGTVTDPSTGTPLSGATVSAYEQTTGLGKVVAATAVKTAITDASGNYNMPDLPAGKTYYFEITKPGYAPSTYYNVTPDLNSNLTLENAKVLPTAIASQTATTSGKVKNASTNAGLPNMSVKIRSGVNNKSGTVVSTKTTDTTGAYSFASLAAGSYTAEVTGNIGTSPIITSYFTMDCVPGSSSNSNQDFAVTAGIATGSYRIVLSWGSNPSDLDSYLTGPKADGSTFKVGYDYDWAYPVNSTTYSSGSRTAGATTEAFIDVDNTSHGSGSSADNGPETTTVVVPRAGVYKFYVHHYSGSSNISSSGAQVKVYKGSALLATYNPPSGAVGDDDLWNVFTMTVSGSGETISAVNTISIKAGTSGVGGGATGACTGPYSDKVTVGTGSNGCSLTGAASSFSLAGGAINLYYRVESAAGGFGVANPPSTGTRFVRLYINKPMQQKDSSSPVFRASNVNIDYFRVSNPGTYNLEAYYVDPAGPGDQIGVEHVVSSTTISVSQ